MLKKTFRFILLLTAALTGASSAATTAGTDPHAYTVAAGVSIKPLQRLGLYAPSAPAPHFAPVTSAVTPKGNVYFITHGWAPGYWDTVKQMEGAGTIPLAWLPTMVDSSGTPYDNGWFENLSATILAADPGATIFFFSWIDWSATSSVLDPWYSERNTDMAGQVLDQAIAAALTSVNPGRIHILGHSHGAKVATVASVGLSPGHPAHLTLFDSPEYGWIVTEGGAANKLYQSPYLPSLPPSRSAGGTFVDNYYSFFGECYNTFAGLSSIVDYMLDARMCSSTDWSCSHAYPMIFYQAANQSTNKSLGVWWSPLLGTQYQKLFADYKQTWGFNSPLSYMAGPNCWGRPDASATRPPGASGARAQTAPGPRKPAGSQKQPRAALSSRPLALTGAKPEGNAASAGGTVTLKEPGSAFLTAPFTKRAGDDSILLDYRFTRAGDGDELAVWLDGVQHRVLKGTVAGTGGHSTAVGIDHLKNGPHQLVLALHRPGQRRGGRLQPPPGEPQPPAGGKDGEEEVTGPAGWPESSSGRRMGIPLTPGGEEEPCPVSKEPRSSSPEEPARWERGSSAPCWPMERG
jgi:hypothetical protein